ncbi:GFA family protein [Roseobacter sp. HKCCD9010]|nr:GFA family protein [Rhodobacterales bacterium HKCCD4356]NNV12267.1 GFA family protein [Roseobacter sp. HKCCD7357]NNV16270.1 GFA family protein [Roseobacter sp. HKCCD8768]NNV25730.1 GFA family protein [Roseobacter sp. HKCCD8192]NNV29986.1 GFA family protein [Roseobacter sp. HKCCD9061]NNV34198.1 GFA family protein [Roseobacter sp. HKCCD9073]NNV38447.1 GFA family protein [Roseobacter sp. HKCCD9054]NNV42404.1 GFA family protein [Roseobacter sp. HKCCD6497]NNV46660.1 GFA family protein [Roseob
MAQFSGGCNCGAVRFLSMGRPDRVGLFHCLEGRKNHGALFYAAAICPDAAVTVGREPKEDARRFFCATCGSSVFARSGDENERHLGAVDVPNQLTQSYES